MSESKNALAQACSSYLRSAMHQPVEWHEWSADAFDKAHNVLLQNKTRLIMISERLIKEETLEGPLFESLFIGEVRSLYDVSRHRASAHGKGLRVQLRIQDPALVAAIRFAFEAAGVRFLDDAADAGGVVPPPLRPVPRGGTS